MGGAYKTHELTKRGIWDIQASMEYNVQNLFKEIVLVRFNWNTKWSLYFVNI